MLRATAVPLNASKHGVSESGHVPPTLRPGEVNCLGHTSVFGYAAHIQKLVQADPKGVPNPSFYTCETTLHLPVEKVVEPASEPLNAEHQLSAPRAIAGVE